MGFVFFFFNGFYIIFHLPNVLKLNYILQTLKIYSECSEYILMF